MPTDLTERPWDFDAVTFDRDDARKQADLAPQPETISELIDCLEQIQDQYGDLEVEGFGGITPTPRVFGDVVNL